MQGCIVQAETRSNILIFEKLLGARREISEDGWHAFTLDDEKFPCFQSSQPIPPDNDLWEKNYQGPDFFKDYNWCAKAEQAIAVRGLIPEYAMQATALTGIDWSRLTTDTHVYEFWFALITLPANKRAAAAACVAAGL
jgi:hypothetical protein